MAHPGNARYRLFIAGCASLATVLLAFSLPADAQTLQIQPGQPVSREQAEAMMRAQRGRGGPPNAQPPTEEKKEEAKEKKDEDKDKKKEEEAPSIKRPEKPPRVPDPREFDVKLGPDNRVPPFNFIGQPWPDVLQWLATISKCSLDWQELPSDYLNLTTQRSYTLDEVRDLVNRHLHARGYTMLQGGEVLSVFKIEKLDPSLVRRVTEDELYDLKPYDFVKVSYEMPEGMAPDKAAEDVKKILSPHAKVFPLISSRRILVIDAVANQRLVSALLNEERAMQDGRMIPREFVLKYARAEQVIDILYVVLGLDPKSRPTQMELQLQQQRLKLMTEMQQKGTDVAKMLTQDGPPVFLAFNRQRNSVLVNAPPEEMRVIERAIRSLDVPAGGDTVVSEGGAGEDRFSGPGGPGDSTNRTFKKYQLVTLDPQKLTLTLEEIGGLSPWTELRADADSKTLFVRATAEDHATIAGLIDQLDGTGRQFEVIWLKRLPADAVAATIFNLMVGQEEEEEEDEVPWYWGRRNRDEKEKKPNQGFRVDADIENNRLLLWVNDAELKEVRRLLAKLGELPGEQSDPRTVRFIEPAGEASREVLLRQFQNAWSTLGDNELIINQPAHPAPAPAQGRSSEEKPEAEDSSEPAEDHSAAAHQRSPFAFEFAQLEVPAAESMPEDRPSPEDRPAGAPPVTLTVTEDGRLMLSSPDTKALDRAEELLGQLSPRSKRFTIFRLKHITAYNMWLNLDEYFYDELHGEDQGYVWDWWGRRVNTGSKETTSGLAKRRKMQIIYDTPSQTILVSNASPDQLREIEQLIAEYDRPAPADSIKARRTAVVKIRYSRAPVIAAAVKEVYRDLLSSRDKEFQSGDKKDQGGGSENVTVIRYGGAELGGDDNKRSVPLKVGFDGALSIGVDEIANMLIISAQEEIFDGVLTMVQRLDEEAAPKTMVHVHRVGRTIDAAALQKVLSEAVAAPWPGGRPEKPAAAASAGQDKKPEKKGDQPDGGRENGE